VKEMRVRLHPAAIGGLEIAQLIRLGFMCVDREVFVYEEVPDFFAALPSI
jgi:hypothetical protein